MTLTCAFGSPWTDKGCGPCKKCQQEAERMSQGFWQDVFFGVHDANGYTPAERLAQQRRQKERSA